MFARTAVAGRRLASRVPKKVPLGVRRLFCQLA